MLKFDIIYILASLKPIKSWPVPGGGVPWLHWWHLQRYTVLHLPTQKSSVCEAQVLPAWLPLPLSAPLFQPHRAVQLNRWVSKEGPLQVANKLLSPKLWCIQLFFVYLCSIWGLPKWGGPREHAAPHRKWWPGCHGGEKERHPGSLQLLLPGFHPLLVSAI